MWNPLLDLLSGVFVLFVEEIDLAQIALPCHFCPYLLCFKESGHDDYE